VTLSLAVGVNQSLPGWLSQLVTTFQPSSWLRDQIDRIARYICHDDAMLLEEGHHLNGCSSLTDLEVMDACLKRGLPVVNNDNSSSSPFLNDCRKCLTNHLQMIAAVREGEREDSLSGDGFRLFTLHLAPLRHHLKEMGNGR